MALDVQSPADAFEVWIVHRSLCRWCSASYAVSSVNAIAGTDGVGGQGSDDPRPRTRHEKPAPAPRIFYDMGSSNPQVRTAEPLRRSLSAPGVRGSAEDLYNRQRRSAIRRETAQRLNTAAGVCDIAQLAKQTGIAIEKVRELKGTFDKFSKDRTALLGKIEFKEMLQRMLTYDRGEYVPERFFDGCWFEDEPDISFPGGTIDFESFLRWYQVNSFEEVLLVPAASRKLKILAHKYKLDIDAVERIHKLFERWDEDGNLEIDFTEFKNVVLSLLGANAEEIPETKFSLFWREATQSSRTLDFESFLLWYVRHFGTSAGRLSGVSLLQEFYRSIRPVPVFNGQFPGSSHVVGLATRQDARLHRARSSLS